MTGRMADTTIIIPTRNRPAFFRRLLKYLSSVRCPLPILVTDSSDEQHLSEMQSVLDAYAGSLKIATIHFPPHLDFPEKIMCSLEWVETPFVTLSADDDFVRPAAIEQCAAFLSSNPDYSLAHGHAVIFNLKDSTNPYYGKINYLGMYNQSQHEDSSGLERLRRHCFQYNTTFYSTHRTSIMKQIWKEAPRTDLEFREIIPSFLSLALGKAKKLDVLYMMRQSHGGSDSRFTPDPLDWMATKDFSEQFHRLRKVLVDCLKSELQGTAEEQLRAVHKALYPYFAFYYGHAVGLQLVSGPHSTIAQPPPPPPPDPRLQGESLLHGESPFSQDVAPMIAALAHPGSA